MSVFGGDSWAREAQYRKRRVDDLLLEDLEASAYKKLSNGKFTCLVCPHNPVLDTPLVLSVKFHTQILKYVFNHIFITWIVFVFELEILVDFWHRDTWRKALSFEYAFFLPHFYYLEIFVVIENETYWIFVTDTWQKILSFEYAFLKHIFITWNCYCNWIQDFRRLKYCWFLGTGS